MFFFRLSSPLFRARTLFLFLLCVVPVVPAFAQSARKHSTPKASPSPTVAAQPSPAAAAYTLPDPVATVDGEPIHAADVERVATGLLANRGKTLQALSDEERKAAFHSVLRDMITDRLVNRQAVNETVNPMDVEKRFNAFRAEYASQEAFENEIKKSGQTPDQIRESLHTQVAQQQWIEHQIADRIKVTPEEVEKFYKEGPPSKFDAPEMISASHILVAVRRDAPPEEALAAEKKANDLAARLKKGESFDDLARANSDDPSTKTAKNPGDLGYFSRDRIMPEFADAAFKLKVGEVSAPVRTQFGYHLIKLTDRKPAHTAPLAEARDQIATYLGDEKRRAAVTALIGSLRQNAKIEMFIP